MKNHARARSGAPAAGSTRSASVRMGDSEGMRQRATAGGAGGGRPRGCCSQREEWETTAAGHREARVTAPTVWRGRWQGSAWALAGTASLKRPAWAMAVVGRREESWRAATGADDSDGGSPEARRGGWNGVPARMSC